MSLTLFTSPKPFEGKIGVIQRNAIHSWRLLDPDCEVILFGNDNGTADVARELSLRHLPNVACNEFGTPRLDDLFQQAQREARHEILCYVNADIILLSDFPPAVEHVSAGAQGFLMIGRRVDFDLEGTLSFEGEWEKTLRDELRIRGALHIPQGIDYFVFRRGTLEGIPPFALGRTVWDNWLIYHALDRRMRVIDVTPTVTAVHQNHDYNHEQGKTGIWQGPEARQNRELAGRWPRVYDLRNAGWILTRFGLLPAITPERAFRRFALWLRHGLWVR